MAHDYTIDHAYRRISVRVTDPVVIADVLALLDRQAADRAWSYTRLEDLRAVGTWVPTSADLRGFLAHIRAISEIHGPRGPIAFVIPERSALFGMFRMYSMLGERSARRLVRPFSQRGDRMARPARPSRR